MTNLLIKTQLIKIWQIMKDLKTEKCLPNLIKIQHISSTNKIKLLLKLKLNVYLSNLNKSIQILFGRNAQKL